MMNLTSSIISKRVIHGIRSYLVNRSVVNKFSSDASDNRGSLKSEENIKDLLDEAAIIDERQLSADDNWHTSPYPKGVKPRDQASHSLRPKVDPAETSIILFPGQGVQYVGMGKKLLKFPSVKEIFDCASAIVNYDVLKLCLEGPEERLNRTDRQQVAVLVCSLAALEALKEERPSIIESCIATAGFSLGELSALVFSEALSFEDAVRLVKVRGEAMQLASEMTPGAMLTVFYGPNSKLSKACFDATEHAKGKGIESPYCNVSNYLFPHCKIIAGNLECIQFIEEKKTEYNLKKMRRLPVAGAFHTPLMGPAVEVFRAALKKVQISDPSIAVHSNIDGKRYQDAQHIRKQLPKHITAPVKWEQTLHILYERPQDSKFPFTYECGPGSSLNTILKMVNAKAWDTCYNMVA